jgi:hypothetical protein
LRAQGSWFLGLFYNSVWPLMAFDFLKSGSFK